MDACVLFNHRVKASEPMFHQKSLPVRAFVVSVIAGAVALVSACSQSATDFAGSGASGAMGSRCTCPGQTADCDGQDGQCNDGLDCMRTDTGNNICTKNCGSNVITGACPANFICKALGAPGQRLACVVAP